MNKRKITVVDILLCLLCIVFAVGLLTFLKTCGPQEDGSFMNCQWAWRAVTGIAIVMAVQAILLVILPEKRFGAGLSIALIPEAVLAILIPGHVIPLCMMETMRCHTAMKPGVLVFGIAIAVLALVNVFLKCRNTAKGE